MASKRSLMASQRSFMANQRKQEPLKLREPLARYILRLRRLGPTIRSGVSLGEHTHREHSSGFENPLVLGAAILLRNRA